MRRIAMAAFLVAGLSAVRRSGRAVWKASAMFTSARVDNEHWKLAAAAAAGR